MLRTRRPRATPPLPATLGARIGIGDLARRPAGGRRTRRPPSAKAHRRTPTRPLRRSAEGRLKGLRIDVAIGRGAGGEPEMRRRASPIGSATSGSSRSCRWLTPGRAPRGASADREPRGRGPARPRGDREHPGPGGRPPDRGRGPVQRARRRTPRSSTRGCSAATAAEMRAGPLHRDARVLREAAHHHRLEGHDQRPPPRRLGRREQRPAHGARPAARGARPGSARGLRVPRPDHPAVHLRRRGLGRDRRAHDREPDPPPARLRPVDAGGLQEPHGRQRAGGGGRRRAPRRCRTPSPAWTRAAARRSSTPRATPTAT